MWNIFNGVGIFLTFLAILGFFQTRNMFCFQGKFKICIQCRVGPSVYEHKRFKGKCLFWKLFLLLSGPKRQKKFQHIFDTQNQGKAQDSSFPWTIHVVPQRKSRIFVGSNVGAVVRALVFPPVCLGTMLVEFVGSLRGISPGTLVFPSHQNGPGSVRFDLL